MRGADYDRKAAQQFVRLRCGCFVLVYVIYIAPFTTINNAELVLSGSITDDDGTLHSITFRHTCFLSQIMVFVTV